MEALLGKADSGSEKRGSEMTVFDHVDVFHLANNLSVAQLRHEINAFKKSRLFRPGL